MHKRFDGVNNAVFLCVNPPYIVDGTGGLNQVLTSIWFYNYLIKSTVGAILPNQNGIVNYPGGGNCNGTTGGGSTGYTSPPLGRVYEIGSKNGGKSLEVSVSSQANGARVQQWTCANASNQKFKLVDAGSGYVRPVNLNSNKSLDVTGPSTADGALINQ